MAEPQGTKRTRNNTIGEACVNPSGSEPMAPQAAVEDASDVREQERVRVINFDHYSKSVWHSINTRYKSMCGSAQYDMAFDVVKDILSTIRTITRLNGLSVLRKVGETIALSSNDLIGHEV
ncbi:uncharacterized protein N7529_005737 [Penicillium soppii]|uniref:uncharacterized protein n=1 Tax=Penicillium soppii TaxID=69789 RepID=UPI0025469704|nr:uncharacterized protein N7529_005737 [Penicillium soppii]KAJ5863821.1 hypothetical protein N7529_005737 [Penicillium soppii]